VRLRHYSRRTEEAYVTWIRRFIVFHGKKHPSQMGSDEIGRYLTYLAVERKVSASTQNQALSALLFLYRQVLRVDPGAVDHVPHAHTPMRVPVVVSLDEVRAVLGQLSGVPWIVVALLYGAGLRLQETLELRVKDLDFDRHQIVVRRGKGQKDRRTMLPDSVKARLTAHLGDVRRQHQRDLSEGLGHVTLPAALERKYPNAATAGVGSSCFPRRGFAETRDSDHRHGIICTNPSCSARSLPRSAGRGSRSASVATPSATPLRRICSRPDTTSERFRNCSATRMSARR
jgi:integrase